MNRVTQSVIDNFSGEHAFLSNFYRCRIPIYGLVFPSSENAYQAMKSEDPSAWSDFADPAMTSIQSKRSGKRLKIRKDWDTHRLVVMNEILRVKFSIKDLAVKLMSTEDSELIEGNYWGDIFWGVCKGTGENHLGRILMEIRKELLDGRLDY